MIVLGLVPREDPIPFSDREDIWRGYPRRPSAPEPGEDAGERLEEPMGSGSDGDPSSPESR